MDDLEEFNNSMLEYIERHRRRIDLTKGVALGLVFGIVGNLFVQFFYPIVEALVLSIYGRMFWVNVTISVISFSVAVTTMMFFRKQLREDEIREKIVSEAAWNCARKTRKLKNQLIAGKNGTKE